MIGKLKGIIENIYSDYILLDVMGIGFQVYLSHRDLINLNSQEKAELHIHTQIRELDISLFGFLEENDKKLFLQMVKVKGVGGKLSLTILGQSSAHDLASAIVNKNKEFFKQISGVGPKLAERIVTELQNENFDFIPKTAKHTERNPISRENQLITDTLSALVNLGYGKSESTIIATNIFQNNNSLTLSEIIRLSLRELTK